MLGRWQTLGGVGVCITISEPGNIVDVLDLSLRALKLASGAHSHGILAIGQYVVERQRIRDILDYPYYHPIVASHLPRHRKALDPIFDHHRWARTLSWDRRLLVAEAVISMLELLQLPLQDSVLHSLAEVASPRRLFLTLALIPMAVLMLVFSMLLLKQRLRLGFAKPLWILQ